jgi:ubiquinone/menaquinone biosynthesis C-methylase UbiE
MKNIDVDNWMKVDGQRFLSDLGVRKEQAVLDFGCGEGHYTIPASKLVGRDGRVYALDKNVDVLDKLKDRITQTSIKNIELINGNSQIPLKENSIDVVLCYDVIHFMKTDERKLIYNQICRILRDSGFFSIYPKHHKKNYPLMELANVELGNVIKEIEESGFFLERKFLGRLLHDDYYDEGHVLNFKKGA